MPTIAAAISASSRRRAPPSSGRRRTGPASPESTSPSTRASASVSGDAEAEILFIPGHTKGHIAFHFRGERALFCGDTLFSLGCGRMFEGTAPMMWASLDKLRRLPPETRVFCGHEYTAANARFAVSIDPENQALRRREREIAELRAQDKPTIPSTMGEERAANPFLRADDPALAAAVGLPDAPPAEVFGEIRRRKDNFR